MRIIILNRLTVQSLFIFCVSRGSRIGIFRFSAEKLAKFSIHAVVRASPVIFYSDLDFRVTNDMEKSRFHASAIALIVCGSNTPKLLSRFHVSTQTTRITNRFIIKYH